MQRLAIAAAIAALTVSAASAAPTPAPAKAPEASIPFVNYGGIRDWQAVDAETLYVQDSRRNWYRATLFAPCIDLRFAHAIGFETRGLDRFDRFSTLRVGDQRCHVRSVVRSEGPPPRKS